MTDKKTGDAPSKPTILTEGRLTPDRPRPPAPPAKPPSRKP